MNDFEKEWAIHEYICRNVVYDYDNYYNGTIPRDSYTHHSLLFKGVGVCGGYSKTMKLLLDMAKIECMQVYEEEHAWNMAKMDGNWYQLDVTWNDNNTLVGEYDCEYFNITDLQMSQDHTWSAEEYPKCNNEQYMYLCQSMKYQEMLSGYSKVVDDCIYYIDTDYNLYYTIIDGADKGLIVDSEVEKNFYVLDNQVY
ncbi:transglutaminase domain-containing protein [Wukongibacter sp. M2B1]|uniref:transglutaminase domain-containing protein n=1 Tax=Wukongibacter sp. M2B1 TaxID=3088895 RepID=UPI003D7BF37B